MSDKPETIADIIAEMRRHAEQFERACAEKLKLDGTVIDRFARDLVATVRHEADRLEAAWKHEKSAIEADALAVGGLVEASHKREMSKIASKNRADLGQLGDCAKLREALEALSAWAKVVKNNPKDKTAIECAEFVEETIKAALAAPPRNCDAGTPKEWCERWMAFCGRYDDDCTGCPCDDAACASHIDCFARWAQMPCEEGGAK